MPEERIIDLRGYSCPQPQLISYTELSKAKSGLITFLVNPGNPVENVTRTALNLKWKVERKEMDGYLALKCEK